MKDEEIIKGNILIAEFMGFKFVHNNPNPIALNEPLHTNANQHPIYMQGYSIATAQFECNWQWLMYVVEKIESLGYYTRISGCAQSICHYFWIEECDTFGDQKWGYNGAKNESKVITTWKGILEFIKWYNSQK